MDPQAAICDLLDAIISNDREAVDELLDALKGWNNKGGFLPKIRKANIDNHNAYYLDR